MSTNNIDRVRAHLFDVLDGLKDKSIDIERAKAICEAAQTIINSAKVEVDYLKVTGGSDSRFLQAPLEPEQLPNGVVGITRHKLRG